MTETIKTEISIQKALFDQAEELARQLHISRGQFLAAAVENFIRDYQRQVQSGEIQATGPTSASVPAAAGGAEAGEAGADFAAQDAQTPGPGGGRREFRQGDVYWVPFGAPESPQAGAAHPYVIIQEDVFNQSRIHTVVVCALTSNMKRAKAPGSVLLEPGEANLPRQSVVEVSKVSAVYKKQFGEYIGSLSRRRVEQILAGMQFLQKSYGI